MTIKRIHHSRSNGKNIMITENKFIKKAATLGLAFALALLTSVTVYATVSYSYDSSQDPVVSLSGLAQYVEDYVLTPFNRRINELSERVSALESNGGGGSGSGIGSEAYNTLLSRISALEETIEAQEKELSELRSEISTSGDSVNGRLDSIEKSYTDVTKQISAVNDSITGLSNSLATLKTTISSLDKNCGSLSDKYMSVTKSMNELQSAINALTGTDGDVTKLQQQYDELYSAWQQIQTEVGVMYRPVFVESGKTIKAKNADEGILVIVRSGYAVVVSPYNTSGTLQGVNDLTSGEELYNGADAPLMHNLLIPRGADDGRGILIASYDGAYVMIGGDYVIVDE